MQARAAESSDQQRAADLPEVRDFLAEMVNKHGFDAQWLDQVFAESVILEDVLESINRPAEGMPWHRYRPIFMTESRVAKGVEFWDTHADVLARAEAEYGVAQEVIVAIIGVETLYGTRKGKRKILDALVTLAFKFPRRAAFFRSELEQYLLLCREESFDPEVLTGSYAGAMGVPQFISSSYRRYAVDFDGDNVRDLLNNFDDAVGSVANYLNVHGWIRDAPIVLRARVKGDGHEALLGRGIRPNTSLKNMRATGVAISAGPVDQTQGALFSLETKKGDEYWVGLQNFYSITRYNISKLYAMAVFQLAEAVREAREAAQ